MAFRTLSDLMTLWFTRFAISAAFDEPEENQAIASFVGKVRPVVTGFFVACCDRKLTDKQATRMNEVGSRRGLGRLHIGLSNVK